MKYNPEKHHRKSNRLKGYDYSQAGAYFVTICAHLRESFFGQIENGEMILNEYGTIVEKEWWRSSEIRKEIEFDAFQIMPNHLHGIVIIRWDEKDLNIPDVGANGRLPAGLYE